MEHRFQQIIKYSFFTLATIMVGFLLVTFFVNQGQEFSPYEEDLVKEVVNYEEVRVEDENTPTGEYYAYYVPLESVQAWDWLIFFEFHQYVEVYINDELRYSYTPLTEELMIGKSLGPNLCQIPIEKDDIGTVAEIRLIPVYPGVKSGYLHFYLAQPMVFQKSMLQLYSVGRALCFAMAFLGIFIVMLTLVRTLRHRDTENLGSLGLFCLLLSVWKVTDLIIGPILFPWNPPMLTYVSLVCLYLLPVPAIAFVRSKLEVKEAKVLSAMQVIIIVFDAIAFGMQLLQIRDLRQNLTPLHILMVLSIVLMVWTVILDVKKNTDPLRRTLIGISMVSLVLCIGIDLTAFYVSYTTDMYFTMGAMFVYVVFTLFYRMRRLTRNASIDAATGLYNKNYCIQTLEELSTEEIPYVLAIMDMNGLKKTNDEYGHDAGDRMIEAFANLLRQQLPKDCFIGRFGGDEFLVIQRHPQERVFEKALENLKKRSHRTSVLWFEGYTRYLSYSEGHVYSTDYPDQTPQEVFEEADRRMYEAKKKHYERQNELSTSNHSAI